MKLFRPAWDSGSEKKVVRITEKLNGLNIMTCIKGKFYLLFLCCLICSVMNVDAKTWKCGVNGNNVIATLKDGILTISGTGEMENYRDKYRKHGVNSPWYRYRSKINRLDIQQGVTSIGSNAFTDCTGLTSITIPKDILLIGEGAFNGCIHLTTVFFNAINCEVPGFFPYPYVFLDCDELKNIYIGNNVTKIPNDIFTACNLTSITIPENVTSIGESAFSLCRRLSSINIPVSITSIGNNAFLNCESLTSISIPNNVKEIGNEAFKGCINLNSVRIAKSIKRINDGLFWGCTNLISITLPEGISTISRDAFTNCTSLISIILPESISGIEKDAFSNCTSLKSVTIPENVSVIYGNAFKNCYRLAMVQFNAVYCKLDDSVFSGCDALAEINIGNKVTYIPSGVFKNCLRLTSVTIPESVTSIGYGAFENCHRLAIVQFNAVNCVTVEKMFHSGFSDENTTLTTINIGNKVTRIPENIFSNCSGLTYVSIPESVYYIGDGAFEGCTGLTSLSIPESVTYIGDGAFSGCTGLTGVYIARNKFGIPDRFFVKELTSSDVFIPAGVTYIGNSAFSNCTGLTSITIPESSGIYSSSYRNNADNDYSPFYIGCNAFYGCNSLTFGKLKSIESLYIDGGVDPVVGYSDYYQAIPFHKYSTLSFTFHDKNELDINACVEIKADCKRIYPIQRTGDNYTFDIKGVDILTIRSIYPESSWHRHEYIIAINNLTFN